MSPVSLLPILPIILIALVAMKLAGSALGIKPAEGSFASIDGLRGYLAFFVFLHHSCLWYFLLHGYGWGHPPSYIYDHFGPTSVCVFFMITSFLFFSKLLDARDKGVDWLKLYVSRFLRIMPLYAATMLLMYFIVGILTHLTLREPLSVLLIKTLKWFTFIQADVNALVPTWLINAGVVWSLAFEWAFYCSLPFIGLLLKIKSSINVLVPALGVVIFFIWAIAEFYPGGGFTRAAPFLSGMLAAILVRNSKIKKVASSPFVSALILAMVVVVLTFFSSVYSFYPLLMMTIVFIAIACGNNVFGVLTLSISRRLGQISYSIYLLHGFVLFIAFRWIWGFKKIGQLSVLQYWMVIGALAMVVVIVSSLCYRFIERPSQDAAPGAAKKIRVWLAWPVSFMKRKPALPSQDILRER